MTTRETRYASDGHRLRVRLDRDQVCLSIDCPGKDRCKTKYACGECEGRTFYDETECSACDGTGVDLETDACWLVSDAEGIDEAFEGGCQPISDGVEIEWVVHDGECGEWGWRLVAPPVVAGERDGGET